LVGKCFVLGLIDVIYNELYGLTIGKTYNTEQLAYYNKANQFPSLIATNINGSISAVILPALSNEQDYKEKVKNMTRKAIKTSSFILFPMMIGLMVIAEPFVKIVLTDKWLPAVLFMQLLCVSYVLWPIHTINLQAISAMGRSDIFLKLEIIKKIIGIIAIIISCPFGIVSMITMKIVTSIISTFINSYPNKELLDYRFKDQLLDILPYMLLSILMGFLTFIFKYVISNTIILLITQIIFGFSLYILGANLLKLDAYVYLINIMKEKIRRGK